MFVANLVTIIGFSRTIYAIHNIINCIKTKTAK